MHHEGLALLLGGFAHRVDRGIQGDQHLGDGGSRIPDLQPTVVPAFSESKRGDFIDPVEDVGDGDVRFHRKRPFLSECGISAQESPEKAKGVFLVRNTPCRIGIFCPCELAFKPLGLRVPKGSVMG